MTTTQAKHTPGITRFSEEHGDITLSPVGVVRGGESVCRVHYNCHVPREESVANGRLLSAACNSYDKHCGARAVECAEADLLGEALGALRAVMDYYKACAAHWASGNSVAETPNCYVVEGQDIDLLSDRAARLAFAVLAKADAKGGG